jgi:hypothetical protein
LLVGSKRWRVDAEDLTARALICPQALALSLS